MRVRFAAASGYCCEHWRVDGDLLAELAAAALVLFITAIGVTIWLCRNREQRRADGKTNVGWVVFLIIAYLLSASYLVFFVLLMISAFTGESVTVG